MDKWNENKIENELKDIIKVYGFSRMPTNSEIVNIKGNYSLSNAIRRNGGLEYWRIKLKMEKGKSETSLGEKYEKITKDFLEEIFGFDCVHIGKKFPYDLLVESIVKIDVKVACLNNKNYFSFNLENKNSRSDFYVCYCLDTNEKINKIYVIPSFVMQGKKQLSLGKNSSDTYDKYIGKWCYIEKFLKKYREFLKETY